MGLTEMILAFFAAASIPSAIVTFLFWNLQRKITQRDKKKEEEEKARQEEKKRQEEIRRKECERKEKDREQMELCLIESVNAAVTLSEATARAVQRIPDANCNGDMHKALEYAENIKHKQRDFLIQKGVQAIME